MKKLFATLLSLALAVTLCACGSFTLDTAALETEVIDSVTFDAPLQKIDNENTKEVYYSLPENVNAIVYRGSSISADQFCIFTAKDSSGANETEQMALELISDLKETFSSYDAEEVTKLNSAIVRKKGNYVILLITNDYENGNKIIDKYLG